jgi:hypothetical protein
MVIGAAFTYSITLYLSSQSEFFSLSNRSLPSRSQTVPALRYRLLNVPGPPGLRRFSPATAATSHMSPCYHSGAARGGTDRLIQVGWGKKLGRQQAYLRTLQLRVFPGGEYRVPAGLLSCGRGGLRLRAHRASLRQDGKKVMLPTTRTLSDSRVFHRGLLCSNYTMHRIITT